MELGLLACVAAVSAVIAHRWGGLRARSLLLVMTPSAVAVVVWFFVAPPSFRFAWGPLFTLAAVPLGWSLWRISRLEPKRTLVAKVVGAGVAMPILLVVAASAAFRFDYSAPTAERTWALGLGIPYAVAPLPEVETQEVATIGGVELRVPTLNEQCWGTFPLCTPTPLAGLTPRGPEISDGFVVN